MAPQIGHFDEPEIPEPEIPLPNVAAIRAKTPELLAAAQSVYDEWNQVDGHDEMLGTGGICHLIAEKMCDVLAEAGFEHFTTVSSSMGQNHVWTMVLLEDGAYEVDIPPGCYEVGDAFTWRKIEDVSFEENDLVIRMVEACMTPEEFERRYAFE